MPLFRVEEVMLNYAEAMCELGEFDQSVADRTVNKLRSRANVAPMKVAEINDSFDPKRDLGNPAYPGDYAVNPCCGRFAANAALNCFPKDSGSTICGDGRSVIMH